ncbi:40S ribosomal protein S19 [Sarcoptes scabiei]|nr:40S ribosomal protein S19 [Sarcoptes scabiei]
MTCVFRRMSPMHRARVGTESNPTLLLDSFQKILYFQKNSKRIIDVPTDILAKGSGEVFYNLFDTQISICSEKVPPDFSDNFDFESRENFINGLLADVELLQHHIYALILDSGYAARYERFHSYDYISCDILQRFTCPIVPDFFGDFHYRRNNVYMQDNVHFDNKRILMKNTAIARNSTIGSNVTLVNSFIGHNCSIGNNVKIINSYIFDDTQIGSDSKIERCLIDSNVKIYDNCNLNDSILAKNVVLGSKMHICNKKLYLNEENEATNHKVVGDDGRGEEYIKDQEDDDEYDEFDQDDSNDGDSDSTHFSESSDETIDSLGDEYSSFYNEVYDSLWRGIDEKTAQENIILEINSSKHAYNVPVKEVNSIVTRALLNLSLTAQKNLYPILKSNLDYGLPIIQNYIKSNESQNNCLYTIEEFHLNNRDRVTSIILVKIIQYLYEKNVLEEDIILDWFYKPNILPDHERAEQTMLRSYKEIQLFIKWLEEAEVETSDEEH